MDISNSKLKNQLEELQTENLRLKQKLKTAEESANEDQKIFEGQLRNQREQVRASTLIQF